MKVLAKLLAVVCTASPTVGLASSPIQEDSQPKTQVFVLGMIHDGHRTSELWGLDEVRATLRAIDPDLVCAEIPPANWPSTLATWKSRGVVEDSRVRVFPEYVDVLMPLTDEMHLEVIPCAGWTPEMASSRRARISLFGSSEADKAMNAAYQRDEQWTQAWFAEHPAPAPDDDPFFIHSPAYDLRSKIELGPYEHHLNQVIGWPGGWTYINHEHFALVREAIEAHQGKRIVVTFGAAHKYWFLEQLRAMPGVELMDVRAFLPGAKDQLVSNEQAAKDELLIGIDFLRACWSDSRGTADQAWAHLARRLRFEGHGEFLQQLKRTRGNQASEFLSGPFFGSVQLESHAGDTWSFKIEVRRLHDAALDAQWLKATLIEDVQALDGFRWTKLDLPGWLMNPGE